MTKSDHDPLDDLFAQAARTPAIPSDDLMARILADASALQPVAAPFATQDTAQGGWFARLWQGLGGWPAVAGLTTATVAGVWIGVDTPEMANDVVGLYFDTSTDVIFVENDLGWGTPSEESDI